LKPLGTLTPTQPQNTHTQRYNNAFGTLQSLAGAEDGGLESRVLHLRVVELLPGPFSLTPRGCVVSFYEPKGVGGGGGPASGGPRGCRRWESIQGTSTDIPGPPRDHPGTIPAIPPTPGPLNWSPQGGPLALGKAPTPASGGHGTPPCRGAPLLPRARSRFS